MHVRPRVIVYAHHLSRICGGIDERLAIIGHYYVSEVCDQLSHKESPEICVSKVRDQVSCIEGQEVCVSRVYN